MRAAIFTTLGTALGTALGTTLGTALGLALGFPALAAADPPAGPPKPPVVWQNRVIPSPRPPAQGHRVSSLTTVSHKLYLNDCKPNGCTVLPGFDDSLTNRSSIPQTAVTLPPYGHGQAHWDQLVQCVRDTFLPFDIEIVTADPGPAVPHFEVMLGGHATQLHPLLENAGGVAPFIACDATENNVISFVFPETTNDLEYLCGAVVQEACHVWGLDHELDAADPMTYLDLGSLKRFQNADANCGESLSSPRGCFCGGPTQNSYRYMNDTFGPSGNLGPIELVLATPRDGQWVPGGFPISGKLTTKLGQNHASFSIDGTVIEAVGKAPIAFNAPKTLPPGDHAVTVSATDNGSRTLVETVTVHVMAACSPAVTCDRGFHCLGGSCVPGSDVAGGLGASCSTNEDCATGSCGDDGVDSLCTAPCEAGGSCPSGFTCASPANVCWPAEGGGCATGGGGSAGLLSFGAGALALAIRRRRRR